MTPGNTKTTGTMDTTKNKEIKILDRIFKKYIPSDFIEDQVKDLVSLIKPKIEGKDPLFIVMLNGGFMFAGSFFRYYNEPAEISFVKYQSYSGTESTGNVQVLQDIIADVKGRNVVILEDIIDTGLTMSKMIKDLKDRGVASITIVSLIIKPSKLKYISADEIDYHAFSISDLFIVGYGMDYNKYGRNLPDIYYTEN